eukprot:gnl/MRDRNA2_/MRDRNA2_63063_c0_seq1.p1 gnl/MRDRNA2_/MRDRNA2_63063_c0~~gnl/MRDRNA2_/MRDRNA2_63063_c0_seq1.p1  ORF type:complete len:162 (+),score=25.89 gnl/MRDRNA2_/MRDRNA2_63063_c0_seq1:39-488(+)
MALVSEEKLILALKEQQNRHEARIEQLLGKQQEVILEMLEGSSSGMQAIGSQYANSSDTIATRATISSIHGKRFPGNEMESPLFTKLDSERVIGPSKSSDDLVARSLSEPQSALSFQPREAMDVITRVERMKSMDQSRNRSALQLKVCP